MRDLGEYVREQRENAQLSVRQLSAVAGISNPYLSQIERGLRRPSADILNALARGLQISAESLYVRAGLLDESRETSAVDTRLALTLDRRLTERQRRIMLDLYDSFVPPTETPDAPGAPETSSALPSDARAVPSTVSDPSAPSSPSDEPVPDPAGPRATSRTATSTGASPVASVRPRRRVATDGRTPSSRRTTSGRRVPDGGVTTASPPGAAHPRTTAAPTEKE